MLRYVSVCIRDDVIHCILKMEVHGAGDGMVGDSKTDVLLHSRKPLNEQVTKQDASGSE